MKLKDFIWRIKGNRVRKIKDLWRFMPIIPENKKISCIKNEFVSEICSLVATKRGLYLIRNGNLYFLLPGEYYGLSSVDNNNWFAFQRLRTRGRIISFSLNGNGIKRVHSQIDSLSPGCHQIDFIQNKLYVTYTYNNRLLVFFLNNKKLKLINTFYPSGTLKKGRSSNNYAHINSILKSENEIFLIFHNETKKTGKFSEIAILDENHKIKNKISTKAFNAHNIIKLNNSILYCNSYKGNLELNGKEVFKPIYLQEDYQLQIPSLLLVDLNLENV